MALPAAKPNARVSVAEYLRREQTASERHEYHDGEILAMSGGTLNHGQICINLTSMLHGTLRRKPCRPFDSNMRVVDRRNTRYVYPDATIICGAVEFDPEDRNLTTLTNPRVVFEVLSDSTEAYDRGDKFADYRHLPSVEEFVLISQNFPRVEAFVRQSDGTWSLAWWDGLETTAKVRCLDLPLPLADLYDRVVFPDPRRPSVDPPPSYESVDPPANG